ncbi:leucine-rich repeat neuronal protein 2-like [Artemia franciscana]|uniref:Uncharacterized protein n=1 Tax=Artemia franciscana TaxID=6661 RepID=A0AA88IXI6_ARTSF|nr:hypothetical protein QYM36_008512 [Artemia franciscana]KAK2728058.1 hypothetical protein QYM36_008512 [Artemia franciscana]
MVSPPVCWTQMLIWFIVLDATGSTVGAVCPGACYCDDIRLEVFCDNAGLDVIPITLNPYVQRLALRNNRIKSIDNGLRVYQDLLYADLSRNKVVFLQNKSFEHQRSLTELHLDFNKISSISNETWQGLKVLTVLTLQGNYLQSIAGRTFSTVLRLKELDLKQNRIEFIHPQAFAGLEDLEVLSLDDNRLTALTPFKEIFSVVPNLAELHLGKNNLSALPSGVFRSLDRLMILDLEDAQLGSISSATFSGIEKLRALKLDGNGFEEVPSKELENLTFLEELSIGKNSFSTVNSHVFFSLTRLRVLDISNCDYLTEIKKDAFIRLKYLESVRISGNPNLYKMPDGIFHSPLISLDLSYNSLRKLSENMGSWDNIEELKIHGNPLYCGCDSLWFIKIVKKIDQVHQNVKGKAQKQKAADLWNRDFYASEIRLWSQNSLDSDEEKPRAGLRGRGKVPVAVVTVPHFSFLKSRSIPIPTCDSPVGLSGMHLTELNENNLGCSDLIPHEILVVLLAAFGFAFLACFAVVWYNRKKIRTCWMRKKREKSYNCRWDGGRLHNNSTISPNPVLVDNRPYYGADYRLPYEGESMINMENTIPRTEL